MNNYYRSDGWVKTSQGPAVPGAQIWVCTQPANVQPPITPPRTLPVPWVGPNPQAQIYSDAGTTPIVQPVITDGFGHYDFYALPGLYTVVVMFGGKVQQFYIDQTLGNAGSSSASALVLSTNGTPNFNQAALNFIQGSGITLSADNFGNMTITGSSITFPGDPTKFLNGTGVFSVPPAPAGLTLQTNGTPNGSQILQNLVNGTGITVTQDGAGNVTVTNTAPATVQPPVSLFCAGYYLDTYTGGIANLGVPVISETSAGVTGSGTAPSGTEYAFRKYTTTASAGVGVGFGELGNFTSKGQAGIPISRLYRFVSRVVLGSTTNLRAWIGMTGEGLSGSYFWGSDNPTYDIVAFRYSSGVDTHWTCYASTDGTHYTTANTTVVPSTTAGQEMRIDFSPGLLTYFIDGVQVATIATNIPSTSMMLTGSLDNKANAVAVNMSWSTMMHWSF